MINTIILGHALNVLPQLPAESVSCVTCSPPYWGLRDYGVAPVVWDEDKKCKHKWTESKTAGDIRFRGRGSIVGNNRNTNIYPIKHRPDETNPGKEGWYKDKGGLSKSPSQSNFCSLCGAWRGSLGLEPDFTLYVKHLCDIFDEVRRVLRKDGTCWVVLGDSYGGSGNRSSHTLETSNLNRLTIGYGATEGNQKATKGYEKSLLLIPLRFAIEMVNRGWTLRNRNIWFKSNCMPSSAKDRFTIDFEDVFFFTKSNKKLFWTNEKTLECVSKQPLGNKGTKGKDWEWRTCPNCQGEGTTIGKALKDGAAPRLMMGVGVVDENTKAFKVCYRCKGSGRIKYSFWAGHDYWFEQQFEELKPESQQRYDYGFNDTAKRVLLRKTGLANHELTKTPPRQGRNKRCVWLISTQPFPEAHFAVYPEGLIEVPVRAGCPEFICKKCGKARVKIYEDTGNLIGQGGYGSKTATHIKVSPTSSLLTKKVKEKKYTGYTDCGCNAGWESGIVLDLFMGAGTTALVALKQRKRFIGIEIKQEYIDMAYKRIARVQQGIF